MRPPAWALRGAALALAVTGCGPHPANDAGQRAATAAAVRTFVRAVAADVTREGPAAWQRQFADGPEFFMASDGRLVFADATAAARGIEALTHALPRIELHFGDDLRVDVLTSELAVVGSSYSEVQTDAHGQERTERGYFTAVAEHHQGRWRLRDAHWSSQP